MDRKQQVGSRPDGGSPSGDRRSVLEAYGRALRREVHVLAAYPELTWQQLHNRLQWEGEAVEERLAPEREHRSVAGARPWFRTRRRNRESEGFIRTLVGHRGAVLCCAFTPDGRRLVSGGKDGTVRVWDAVSGEQMAVLHGHEGMVHDCVIVGDGAVAVTAGRDGTLRAWEIGTQTALGVLLEVDGPLLSCAAASCAEEVFAAGVNGTLHAITLSVAHGAAHAGIHRSSTGGGAAISALAVAPDGTAVACGHGDGSVTIWDPHPFHPHRTAMLGAHADIVFTACFTPDGTALLTGDGLGVLRLWNWPTRRLVREVQAHSGVINDCAILPNGNRCVSVGDDTKIRIESLGADHSTTIMEGHYRPATCCAVSPSGTLLASGSDDATIRIWELGPESARCGERVYAHDRWAVASTFSADGTRLVTGSRDGDMIVWNPETGEMIDSLGPQPGLEWCALSPDGDRVVSCGDEAVLWEVASGGREAILSWKTPVRWCGFSPDGELIAGFDPQGKRVWDLTEPDPPFVTRAAGKQPESDKKRRVAGPDFHIAPCRCAFSPLGSRIATPGPDGTVLVWEIDADRPHVLGRHDGEVSACAWDPEGQVVASAGQDQVVRLWDVRHRMSAGTLKGHDGWINHLEFLDRGLLVSVGSDGTVRLWDTRVGSALCCYPAIGNVFLSCAAHPGHRWLCVTDIAGDVHWLALEWVRVE